MGQQGQRRALVGDQCPLLSKRSFESVHHERLDTEIEKERHDL
jgi:hypothetical protein